MNEVDDNIKKLLEKFKSILQDKVDSYNKIKYPNISPETVTINSGRKYMKIDIGDSGKFMYDPSDENLYYIKSYGVIDRKKNFGNLKNIIINDFKYDGFSIIPLYYKGISDYGYAGKIG